MNSNKATVSPEHSSVALESEVCVLSGFTTPTAMALNPLGPVSRQHSDFRNGQHGGEESTLCSQPARPRL